MKHRQRVDIDPRFVIAIECMKMRRIVIIMIHADDDAIETANSGTSEVFLEGGEKFFERFASQFQIKRVGINLDLI
jgi:hypothetical protein